MKSADAYAVSLADTKGNGDFLCPKCGNAISPDDESEDNYSILEPRVDSRGLYELVIRCNKCGSNICLTGFSFLPKVAAASVTRHKCENRKNVFFSHI